MESWRIIPGIETHEVSSIGRIRSIDRISFVPSKAKISYQRVLKGRILNCHESRRDGDKQGYVFVSINNKTYTVHRLVGLAFLVDSYFDGAAINHKDGNKYNNCVDNLEWVTLAQNEKHSYDVLGKQTWNKGKRFYNPKAYDVRKTNYLNRCIEILKKKKEMNWTDKELSNFYNMSERQINCNLQVARNGGAI